jgi:hypothetical protein
MQWAFLSPEERLETLCKSLRLRGDFAMKRPQSPDKASAGNGASLRVLYLLARTSRKSHFCAEQVVQRHLPRLEQGSNRREDREESRKDADLL